MTIYATLTQLNTEISRRTAADKTISGTNIDPTVTLATLAARLTALEQAGVVVVAPTGLHATTGNQTVTLGWT